MYTTQPTQEFTSLMPVPRAEDVWMQQPTLTASWTEPVAFVAATEHVAEVAEPPRARPQGESLTWLMCKHAAQAMFVAAVLVFVFAGGNEPAMAISYVAASLMLLGGITLADRQRFLEHEPAFEIVHVHAPAVTQGPMQVAMVPQPLHVAMPARISVT
ncbi:MAG: hypothetical protein JWO69_1086 [Thermoleophilia bacterium]|jgi:hypothetical protein|nr:hypothetical protein [Thermoleophilia bacterium]